MTYIVVAGIPGCRKLAGIVIMAEYLEKKFSYFIVHQKFVKREKWKDWLKQLTKKNGWNHFTLPIVWRELPYRGGKQCLIGGYSSFMEYCLECYGVELSLSKKEMRVKGFQMLLKEIHDGERLKNLNILPRCVCICGASSFMLSLMLPSLMKIPNLATADGLILGFYDENINQREALREIVEEFENILPSRNCSSQYFTAHVVNDLTSVVKICDLMLVIIPDFNDFETKSKEYWTPLIAYVTKIGNTLAFTAKDDIRVILLSESQGSPICLCAAVLAQAALPNVKSQNVVAITAGIGIMVRSMLAYSLNVPLSQIENVPVWGFSDISHIVEPPQATTSTEVRYCDLSVLAKEWIVNPKFRNEFLSSYIWPLVGRRLEEIEILLGRKPFLAQVEALLEIVSIWYSDNMTKKQAFLGIYSDGTFGIPPGIFFSQPVVLINGIWRPNQEHSLPTDPYCKICDLFDTAILLTEIYFRKNKSRLHLMGLGFDSLEDYILNEGKDRINFGNELACEQSPNFNQDFEIISVEEIDITEEITVDDGRGLEEEISLI